MTCLECHTSIGAAGRAAVAFCVWWWYHFSQEFFICVPAVASIDVGIEKAIWKEVQTERRGSSPPTLSPRGSEFGTLNSDHPPGREKREGRDGMVIACDREGWMVGR